MPELISVFVAYTTLPRSYIYSVPSQRISSREGGGRGGEGGRERGGEGGAEAAVSAAAD